MLSQEEVLGVFDDTIAPDLHLRYANRHDLGFAYFLNKRVRERLEKTLSTKPWNTPIDVRKWCFGTARNVRNELWREEQGKDRDRIAYLADIEPMIEETHLHDTNAFRDSPEIVVADAQEKQAIGALVSAISPELKNKIEQANPDHWEEAVPVRIRVQACRARAKAAECLKDKYGINSYEQAVDQGAKLVKNQRSGKNNK